MKKVTMILLFVAMGTCSYQAVLAQQKNFNSSKTNTSKFEDEKKCGNKCCLKEDKGTAKECKEKCCAKKLKKEKAKKEKDAEVEKKED